MIKSEWSVVRERWEVLQAINHEFNSRDDAEIYLRYRSYHYTENYIDNNLKWLEKEDVIEIDWPDTAWRYDYDPIGINIINVAKFKKLYEEYKQKYEMTVKQQEISSLGLDIKLIFNKRAGLLQWFSLEDKPLGRLTSNSERSKKIFSKLFGASETTLRMGITKIWPSKTTNISGLATDQEISEKQVNDTIDQINRHLETNHAPIFIQRSDKAAFITAIMDDYCGDSDSLSWFPS